MGLWEARRGKTWAASRPSLVAAPSGGWHDDPRLRQVGILFEILAMLEYLEITGPRVYGCWGDAGTD